MWRDANGDGICDERDDSDGDGIPDTEEAVYGLDCAVSDPEDADTDDDGVGDNQDPYPRDEFHEFLLFRNDLGTIDFVLSNRDGSFQTPVEIGTPMGGSGVASYRYISFAISDWDNDGKIDFLATADPYPGAPGPLDLWYFWRFDTDTSFEQRLVGQVDRHFLGTVADLDGDELMDVAHLELDRPNYVADADLYFYQNSGLVRTALCAITTDPTNPQDCLFVKVLAVDLMGWAGGQWVVNYSRQAIDVNGDGHRDIALYSIANGGAPPTPVSLILGRGDGTFDPPGPAMFTHNANGSQSPANAIMFADFDNDGWGDVVLGLDDDGDAASAWFYPGTGGPGGFAFDLAGATEAFDLNPAHEAGGEHPGPTSAARNFDVDFDGRQDVIVGWRYQSAWTGPSETVFLRGLGDGTFAGPQRIRDFPLQPGQGDTNNYGLTFALPQRLCPRFPIP
jgi:hypothetical protein